MSLRGWGKKSGRAINKNLHSLFIGTLKVNFMNKLLTFPLCFCILFCQGQLFSVSSDKNNVLYAGVENPLTITVQNILPKDILVKTDNGTLSGANGHYVFYTDTGDVANLTLYKKSSNGNVKIGVSSFRVRQLPDPRAHVGG